MTTHTDPFLLLFWLLIAAVICALLVILAGNALAAAADPGAWTWEDTALQATFTALLLADRSQTLQIRTEGREEYFSVLLSERPTHERTNRLFAAYLIGHTAVAIALDKPYRNLWQIGFILFETNNVRHNTKVGIEARLHF